MLAVRLLGPLDVSLAGRPVRLTSPKLRTLLVMLAMDAGSPVPVNRLAAAMWDDELPEHVRRSVQIHLTRLRGVVGADLIATEPAGYRLRLDADRVDALRFIRLLDAAAAAPDVDTERARLSAALELWRGSPFENVRSHWLTGLRARLVERYLTATERRADLDLAAGRHGELVGPLRELTAAYPLRESLWLRLLIALDHTGRQAEALTGYESIRRHLADELGADPGPELRQIHADLLAGRRARLPASAPPARAVGASPDGTAAPDLSVVPRQLPADVQGFTGRADALKALHELVGDGDRPLTRAVVISAIGGMAGIGKTSLAVHWAHEVADRFPDGQLYVNLRGFHPGQAMPPAEVIRGFLAALGVPAARVPADPDAQVGLYRSLVAGRRMLVVLDNARDPDQLRPLLPGSPTCVVVVTSRNRFTGLVATEAARPLVLDPLPADEARALLEARLGADRIAAEPAATDAIVARCGGLPLALAVTAARAATDSLSLATLAHQLDDELSTLDTLDTGDPAADARVVFSWSYRALRPAAARLFRLLGLHPGPDVGAAAVASLAGMTRAEVSPLLAELCGAHLLTEPAGEGRYAMHDLLRAFATDLVRNDTGRRPALGRLFDHYLHTAYAASRLINPYKDPISVAPAASGVTPEYPADALAWYTAEHRVLLAVVAHAVSTGFDAHAWRLVWALSDFLHRRGHWHEWRDTQHVALAAAGRLGDARGQAIAHRGIATACSNLGRHGEAEPHIRRALDLYEQLGDETGRAHTHLNLSALLTRQGHYAEALHHCERALGLHTGLGDRLGEAKVRNSMGFVHAKLGHHEQALAHCERAAALYGHLGDRNGLAHTWDSIGYAHHRLGRYTDAVADYRRAGALFEELGSPAFLADTLVNLGETHAAAGDPESARAAWQRAFDVFAETGHPRAAEVRALLDGLPAMRR